MIVVDASAVVELLLGTPRARPLATRIATRSSALHAPHLVDLEVTSVVRRYEAAGALAPAVAARLIDDLHDLDISRHPHDVLLPRVWQLRANLTPYDAAYVALAEALGVPLATYDARLAAAPGHRAAVELYP
jgi:predicted nucleic acid-binding protein